MPRRVVVIGAGHNGLIAGVRLAEVGHSVTVVDAAPEPGGGVRSAELTLPGFVHDTCSAFFPLAAASPAFRELELDVEWVNPDVAMVHVLDDGEVALHRSVGDTAASLEACAGGAGEAWGSLMARLVPQAGLLVRAALGRFPPVGAGLRLLAALRSDAPGLAAVAVSSSAVLGRRLFGNENAAGWLAGSGAHADVSPYAAGSGAFSLGLNFLGHVVGWPFPRGGAGRLTDALVARLVSAGGAERGGSAAVAVEVRARRVVAVRLSNEERLEADAVLCTASPGVLMSLLPDGALPVRVSRRLRGWRYGLGTLKLDYALRAPVPWRSEAARRAGVVHVGGPLSEIAASLGDASAGRVPERPALVVGQQSLFDSSRAPDGQHTLYVYARVPQDCDGQAAVALEDQLERFAPGFRSTILDRCVRTPADIERENPSMRGGDLASGSFELDQQLIFRPDPRLCRYRTPLRGLYAAGAWVHPGAGVHGMSGRNAADTLLQDIRLHRI